MLGVDDVVNRSSWQVLFITASGLSGSIVGEPIKSRVFTTLSFPDRGDWRMAVFSALSLSQLLVIVENYDVGPWVAEESLYQPLTNFSSAFNHNDF